MQVNFDFIDIVFSVLVIIIVIRCVIRGFVAEIMSMAAVFLGLVVSVILAGRVAGLLDQWIGVNMWNQLIAFLVLFLLTYLVVKLIEKVLHNALEKLKLDKLDKALGLFLGILEGLAAVAVIIFVLKWLESLEGLHIPDFVKNSFYAGFLLPLIIPVTESLAAKK